MRERQKIENKKDGEESQRLQELYQWGQRMEEERQAKQKRDLMQAHLVGTWQHRYLCPYFITQKLTIIYSIFTGTSRQ